MANRICVSGRDLDYNETDRLDLRTVNYGFACLAIDITGGCTQRAKWAGNVSFIWPGGYDGGLYRSPSDPLPSVFFSAGDTLTSVDPASAVIVEMYGTRLN